VREEIKSKKGYLGKAKYALIVLNVTSQLFIFISSGRDTDNLVPVLRDGK